MRSFLISDNRDTWVGLRLVGIDGVIVKDRENALKVMKESVKNQDIGILILTEKIVDMIKEEYYEYKLKSKTPLIIEIPDRHGSIREYNAIKNYIRDSVGIHI
ncbi:MULTISPECIES: V-type ATP synthase subunit F [Sedimentibacter]|uniref:V-type ATP synthase subunit F n=1 Tax=Sedimentibacter hydroxybenzoicus DSM 7310 TaxID=1123245 RepID=A0A974BMR2_SEDHY|nr:MULTISPECIES: V-type ATP synthase subunit F [Sedimentibacter]NYB76038.1 V-type ATP synthase subunit F [Sedimentibacter hydroxybenzoicus DSM 7310]HCX62172.1 ATP synthase subunit F [Clostridiales bacterium]